jgi:TonB-linked SusC/RagA family outer membrane protein
MKQKKINLKIGLSIIFLFLGFCLTAQNAITVKGRILDNDSRDPLIGASVLVKATTIGTITDASGDFTISVPKNGILVVSYIGYEKTEVAVNGRTNIDITMKPDSKVLDEVVSIGYGSARKKDLSGAIATTKVTDIMKGQSSDLSSILQGQMPGVTIQANGGDPASSNSITVRGSGDRSGEPVLIVVDGIPGAPYNVEDVETVTVLKDAATAAIYGATAGSGGVIIITTKKAKAGKIHVDANVYDGVKTAWKKPGTLTSAQYNQVWATAVAADGGTLPTVANPTLYPYGTATRTNWVDEIFRQGNVNHYAVSLSGGTDAMTALFSVAYDHQDGIMLNTYKNGLVAKMALDYQLTKWAKFSQSFNYQYSNTQGGVSADSHEAVLMDAIFMPPSATVYEHDQSGKLLYNADGTPQYGGIIPAWAAAQGISGYGHTPNPVAALMRLTQYRPQQTLHSTSALEIKPFRGLIIRSDFSADFNPTFTQVFNHSVPEIGLPNTQNNLFLGSSWDYGYISQTTATYNNNFNDKHDLTVMVGNAITYNKYNSSYTQTFGYASEDPHSQIETNATNWSQLAPQQSISELASIAWFARLSYSYDDRYFLNSSIRRDASSKLYFDNNSGVFPAVSGAWKISSEKFFKTLELPVSLLKVRASWGEVGNVTVVPNYSYNTLMANDISQGNVTYIGTGLNNEIYGRYQQSIANRNLKWESTISSDFGIDLNLFNDKLSLSADYYDKNTSNLLDYEDVPSQAGIQLSPIVNIGNVTNKGFEFNAGYKQSFGKVQVSVYANYSTNVNNVENIGANKVYIESTNVNSMYPLQSTVGQPWHSYYLIKTAGIFQTQDQITNYTWADPTTGVKQLIEPHAKPGDLIFVDANHDGKITDADRQYMGSYAPKSTYGFGTTISWNGFDFNIFFQGVSGNKIFNSVKQMGLVGGTAPGGNLLSIAMDSWNFNKNSGIPRLGLIADNNGNYTTVSDFFLEDGSYLRLKNISIGYTIPKRVLSKIGMSDTKFRFYVTGQNLLTFTKYSGLDPEVGNNGVDGGTYPVARVLSAGFNFTF